MVVIIAEKPSLARNIAAGIGQMQRRDGYLEGCGYFITWAFGHLFSLADIEAYSPAPPETNGHWCMDNLPCIPKDFRFELRRAEDKKSVDAGVKKQFEVIKYLCNRPDVDTVVNAGDADREGEIIVRLCIRHALTSQKSLKRLWLPDQTPETVAAALLDMKDESEYENLAGEGYARTCIDWLYGVNLTRYATLKCGTLLRVGRVIIPIVRAIYDRDMAIRNFVPGKYLAIVSNAETDGEKVELTSKQKFEEKERAKAELIQRNLRLVVYIARKFDNTGVDNDDLVSIGTIGLIKAINSFRVDKNIKLATYASRCIENEILMYLRRTARLKTEVSFDEPLNTDFEGNELLLSDVLGTSAETVYGDIESNAEKEQLKEALKRLTDRERKIMFLRFGLGGGEEMTQKDVADLLGISQSYISRLEKKIILRLKKEIAKME